MTVKQTRYLLQLGSNHIYVWTETLSKKNDMIEIDKETAVRIQAGETPKVSVYKPPTPQEIVSVVFDEGEANGVKQRAIDNYKKQLDNNDQDQEEVDVVSNVIEKRETKTKSPESGSKGVDGIEEVIITEKLPEPVKVELAAEDDPGLETIMKLKNKNKAEEYALTEFKVSINRDKSLSEIKEDIVDLYKAKIAIDAEDENEKE